MKQAEVGMESPANVGSGVGSQPGRVRKLRSAHVLEAEIARLSARVDELERDRSEQEHEYRELESFVAMAAHELLKPLVMTEAYATLIAERSGFGLDLESRRDLSAIAKVSSRVRRLIDALLSDARDSDRPLRREQVDLSQVLEQCLETLDSEIREREVRVDVDPMPVVEGNPALLTGVFGNLLSNALRYGARDGADIRVTVDRSEAGWTFGVQSPGPAIPSRDRERLFEPWQRGRGERRDKGAGLGLAIVRRIVERHGGEVGVTSPTDTSNSFFFTLPGGSGP
jgi:light-regulated signal transduction histidine kinase (bacteriophytochrome)